MVTLIRLVLLLKVFDMLTVNYTWSGLHHSITGEATTVIRYIIDEALYTGSIDIINVSIDNVSNDSPVEN